MKPAINVELAIPLTAPIHTILSPTKSVVLSILCSTSVGLSVVGSSGIVGEFVSSLIVGVVGELVSVGLEDVGESVTVGLEVVGNGVV